MTRYSMQAEPKKPRLLVLDDDRQTLDIMAIAFSRRGFDVVTKQAGPDFFDAQELHEVLADIRPDCVLSDYDMGSLNGADAYQTVRHFDRALPFILHTNSVDQLDAARLQGSIAVRHKPVGNEELANHTKSCTELFSEALKHAGKIDIFAEQPKGHAR